MNKQFCFLTLLFIFIISCKKEDTNADCVMLSQNPSWVTSDFKNNYIIQFPVNYLGEGKIGFEGNIFRKVRNDSSVVFNYAYCSPLFCTDFGDALVEPLPNSVNIKINGSTINLNQKTTFCDGNIQTAILYYSKDDNAYARLYWKDDGAYKQALEISYNQSRLQEVLDIIKTIKEK